MQFPTHRYEAAEVFVAAYRAEIERAWSRLDGTAVARAIEILLSCIRGDATLFVCGNGGSAAIANHLVCDFEKGIRTSTDLAPRVVSLSANIELMTAIANDIGYEDVFIFQLESMARTGDALIAISSSGDSENIIRALTWARGHGVATIGLTGFTGGRSAPLADVQVHVPASNYGVVEDVHQSVMHMFAQFIRQAHMKPAAISMTKF